MKPLSTTITPIAYIRTPYKEKFTVPRQANLVPSARSQLYLTGDYNHHDAIEGLLAFSHLWLIFLFDQHIGKPISNSVRPPRLGGNKKVGVFASRSPFRPNHIGMSAVKLLSIYTEKAKESTKPQIILELGSVDLVDNTPIIDIKPYIAYSDRINEAISSGYAETPPQEKTLHFTKEAKQQLHTLIHNKEAFNYVIQVISETLILDPRPAYRTNKADFHQYAAHLFDFNVRFHVESEVIIVDQVEYA